MADTLRHAGRLHHSPIQSSSLPTPPSPLLQPVSPHSPLSFTAPSQQQSIRTLHQLPIEYPPGMQPPRQRTRRPSVSAESDRPNTTTYTKVSIPKTPEQMERIKAATRQSILFSGLDSEQQQEIIDSMTEVKVKAGDTVIRQNEAGDYFYVIDHGIFDVYKETHKHRKISNNSTNPQTGGSDTTPSSSSSPAVAALSPPSSSSLGVSVSMSSPTSPSSPAAGNKVFEYVNGGSFGELALMYNCPRAATVKARTDGCLWRVDRETFRHIVIASTAKKRKLFEEALEAVPLLANLSKQERAQVADTLETITVQPGEVIIRQGEIGDSVYFVIKGEAKATQTIAGKKEVEVRPDNQHNQTR